MAQQKIDDYFPIRRESYATQCQFLALPRSIREIIYTMANLGPNHFINLNCWVQQRCPSISNWDERLDDNLDQCFSDYERGRLPDRLPLSLLLVCRSISHEAQEILYGSNYFAVSQQSPAGLRALELLSARAVQNLQFLIVHLTPCRCITPHCIQRLRFSPHTVESFDEFLFGSGFAIPSQDGHSRPLSNVCRTDRGILEQWKRICSRIAAHAIPGKLRLYVICHVQDSSVAGQLLQPLFQLPTLRDCGICLGPSDHSDSVELRNLAKIAVQRMTYGLEAVKLPFRFLDLPRELQLKILSDSPLVLDFPLSFYGGRYITRAVPHSCGKLAAMCKREPPMGAKYFCPIYSASFCTGCDRKYAYLSQIFCVSKAFSDLVTEVFYSKNSFIIHTWQPHAIWEDSRYLKGIYRFLSGLSLQALRLFSRLDILLPPIDESSFSDEQFGWEFWQQGIRVLADNATLSRLVLSIKIGDYQSETEQRARREHFIKQKEQQTLQIYEEITRPLIQLRGLKALFIHVPYPFGEDREESRVETERKLERMVMGPNYNAYAVGKPPPCSYTQPFFNDPRAW